MDASDALAVLGIVRDQVAAGTWDPDQGASPRCVRYLHWNDVVAYGQAIEDSLLAIASDPAATSLVHSEVEAALIQWRTMRATVAAGEAEQRRIVANRDLATRELASLCAAARATIAGGADGDELMRIWAGIAEAVAHVTSLRGDTGAMHEVADIEREVACRVLQDEVAASQAWRTDFRAVVRRTLPHCLNQAADVSSSPVLAAVLFSDPKARAKVRNAVAASPGLVASDTACGAVLALCDWADASVSKPKDMLHGQDPIGELRGEHLRLAREYGNQPRRAEMIFERIYEDITHGRRADLVDLNIAALRQGAPPWPRQDWLDVRRCLEFDVKCNLWRGPSASVGLRGFFVGTDSCDPHVRVAAFVFSGCEYRHRKRRYEPLRWSFIGFVDESKVRDAPSRVVPFVFDLPDDQHFDQSQLGGHGRWIRDLLNAGQAAGVLSDPRATSWSDGIWLDRERLEPEVNVSAVKWSLDLAQLDFTVEWGVHWHLWETVTRRVLGLRASGSTAEQVDRELDRLSAVLSSRWFLYRLPSVDERSLILRWIDDVLRPLNSHLDEVRCPSCGSDRCQVRPGKVSRSGAVRGTLACLDCSGPEMAVTLITHCHRCQRHPLVIGKRLCQRPTCGGIVCDGEIDGQPCGACRCNASAA